MNASAGRADCWFGGTLVFYEKQSLRWRWRGNLILLAVRETRLTSQQKSVRFPLSSVSGGNSAHMWAPSKLVKVGSI